jgi:hypothetical protein
LFDIRHDDGFAHLYRRGTYDFAGRYQLSVIGFFAARPSRFSALSFPPNTSRI